MEHCKDYNETSSVSWNPCGHIWSPLRYYPLYSRTWQSVKAYYSRLVCIVMYVHINQFNKLWKERRNITHKLADICCKFWRLLHTVWTIFTSSLIYCRDSIWFTPLLFYAVHKNISLTRRRQALWYQETCDRVKSTTIRRFLTRARSDLSD